MVKFLFLDEGTIANDRRRYKEGGIMELIVDHYSGRKAKAVPGKAKKEEQELFILEYYRLKQEVKIYSLTRLIPSTTPSLVTDGSKRGRTSRSSRTTARATI
jgi:hypothetical protein